MSKGMREDRGIKTLVGCKLIAYVMMLSGISNLDCDWIVNTVLCSGV